MAPAHYPCPDSGASSHTCTTLDHLGVLHMGNPAHRLSQGEGRTGFQAVYVPLVSVTLSLLRWPLGCQRSQ